MKFNLPKSAPQAKKVLQDLGISTSAPNFGVFDGSWFGDGQVVESVNPATGEVLASVRVVCYY